MPPDLKFFAPQHPIQSINPDLKAALYNAQNNHLEQVFPTAGALVAAVLAGQRIQVTLPAAMYQQPVAEISDVPYQALVEGFTAMLEEAGVPPTSVGLQAQACARDLQLLRAFEDPTAVMRRIEAKVTDIVNSFPRTADDLECGKNPGDVIDPFVISAAQILMYSGDFEHAVGAAVAHKCFMIIEDLLGHLHEDVLGLMRGNVRIPEPRGKSQHTLHAATNPFPGADIVQPPFAPNTALRFHQIKNKTGSAKGGDGKRLGEQLENLRAVYGGDVFYDSLIGSTLRGHRSRTAVERAAPGVVVLVGGAAFTELTGSTVGPELLLRMYQAAFDAVARATGYSTTTIVATVVAAFAEKAQKHGDSLLETMLKDVVVGPVEQQDSRQFVAGRAGRKATKTVKVAKASKVAVRQRSSKPRPTRKRGK